MEKREGYFDTVINLSDLLENSSIDEVFYYKDLQQRKLYFNDQISSLSVEEPIRRILQFNREDENEGLAPEDRKPILIYLTSVGGSINDGFALIDTIMCSKTPIYTINIGYQYSMGFLIGLAGHKRFAFKNSQFLLHDGYTSSGASTMKAFDNYEFQKRVESRIKEYVLSLTTIPEKEYDDNIRVEWYMFAEDAKKNGVVDYIVGEDCELTAIV